MKYRVITVSRQYGSGGGRIASLLATRLGWTLLDQQIIDAVAKETGIERSVVERNDERVTGWFHRVNREALRGLAAVGGAPWHDEDFFDPDYMAKLAIEIIGNAYVAGNCVIVGRGAQCMLQDFPDAFKVFIYAPDQERLHNIRMRSRRACDYAELREMDKQHEAYIRTRFERDWQDIGLYDLMISSKYGAELTTSTILHMMQDNAAPTQFQVTMPKASNLRSI